MPVITYSPLSDTKWHRPQVTCRSSSHL